MPSNNTSAISRALKRIKNPHVASTTKDLFRLVKQDLTRKGKLRAVAACRLDTIIRIALLMPGGAISDELKIDIFERIQVLAKQEKLDSELTSIEHSDCKCGGFANGCVSAAGKTCLEWFDHGRYVGCSLKT